jgi:fatty acid desaturase
VAATDTAYAELRRSVVAAGLLERAYTYYAWRSLCSFGFLGAGVALSPSAPLLACALIAFGSVQVALIGHDAGHQAILRARQHNNALATLCWTAALGISFRYWNDRHDRHHASPNQPGADPDLDWSFGPALTPLLAFTLRVESWGYATSHRDWTELALICINALAWLAPLVWLGPGWLLMFVFSQLLASLYLAAVVGTNHVGMPTVSGHSSATFLERQLRSSRNVVPHPLTDFVFGGLNYQIEHHLFTTMPRNHFSRARVLIKRFCVQQHLPYTECGVIEVYRLVLHELPRLGAQRA